MDFAKVAEKQVYERVQDCTRRLRNGDVPHPAVLDVLRQHGIDVSRSVFPCFGELDDNLYNGTVVSQDRRVFEFVIDTAAPGESTVDDVTAQLGPKDPRHPKSDVKDVITMSLFCFDKEPQ
ncbi:MAG: hypothetical protein ACLGHJ_04005 [Gammaproteobacteria bacterium]